jgi:hypothetical protein
MGAECIALVDGSIAEVAKNKFKSIEALVNNAGIYFAKRGLTEAGHVRAGRDTDLNAHESPLGGSRSAQTIRSRSAAQGPELATALGSGIGSSAIST